MNKRSVLLTGGANFNPAFEGLPARIAGTRGKPDPGRISEAAQRLNRPVQYVDDKGYKREVVAAAPVGPNGELAYVACSEKDMDTHLDISYHLILRGSDAHEAISEVETYNPFFGCHVRFLEWCGNTAILIYEEKHDTYIAACTREGPARYVEIARAWVIHGNQIGFWGYGDKRVSRLSLPKLEKLKPLSEAEALEQGLRPEKDW